MNSSFVIVLISLLTIGIVQCYDNCLVLNANPSIQMEWTISGSSLSAHVTSAATGWTGIGFHATPCTTVCMPGTDYVIASNGTLSSMTKISGGADGAPVASTAQIITSPVVSSSNSSLQFTFTRALLTGSVNISTSTNQSILFAFGNANFGYHGVTNRNILPINWANNGYLCARTTTGSGVVTTGKVSTTGGVISGSGNSTGNSGGNHATTGRGIATTGAQKNTNSTSTMSTQSAIVSHAQILLVSSWLLLCSVLSLVTLF